MHELHDYRAFTDPGSYTLHGTVAHIADHKNTRDVGLQQTRVSIQGPRLGPLAIAEKIRARQYETTLIALDKVAQPRRAGLRSDKDKQAGGGKLLRLARAPALDGDSRETLFAVHRDEAGLRPNLNLR